MDYNNLSNIKDIRIYAQLLLDFFESLAMPTINYDDLRKIDELYNKYEEPDISELFACLRRHEFHILSTFSTILKAINQNDPKTEPFNLHFGKRVGISLLILRKKLDKLFIGRTLATFEIDNKPITTIAKIINSFSKIKTQDLNEKYQSSVSPIMKKVSKGTTLDQMKTISKFATEGNPGDQSFSMTKQESEM
jgi:hypothetical protein